jgi:4'-phosphopantetheinyl transferase
LNAAGHGFTEPAGGFDVSVWALRVPRAGARTAAHRLLRTLLSRQLGVSPDEIELVRERCGRCGGPNGRPAVRGAPGVHFSLAYAGALALVALAPAPVGVDVERPVPGPAWRELSPLLHPAERRELERAGPGLRTRALSRVWTRKEACLKAIGAGLAHGLREPYVGAGARPAVPPGWILRDVVVPGGHTAAVALCVEGLSEPRVEDRGAALHVRWA